MLNLIRTLNRVYLTCFLWISLENEKNSLENGDMEIV